MVRKAVILAAGSATRMQEGVESYISNPEELSAIRKGEKMAARFGRFPFLDYQVLRLIKVGVKQINLVLKPEDNFFTGHYHSHGRLLFPEAEISFSFQRVSDGTAHAVLCAGDFVGKERFLVLNGDNHYPRGPLEMFLQSPEQHFSMVGFDAQGFNPWVKQRLHSFAVIKSSGGKLQHIVEKSENPQTYVTTDLLHSGNQGRVEINNRLLVSMNLWCFNPDIIDACRRVPRHPPRSPGKNGEYELPDAVRLCMQEGKQVLVYYACEDILDLTHAEDLEIVSRRIRENLKASIEELEERYKNLL
ncbi:MAG: sugar phosphate nucleotidyltransferase [Spirochaetota bacterium]